MDVEKYFKSLSLEFTSLKNRIRELMDDPHWLTDGEWKESVLRSTLQQKLPKDILIGRGFILTPSGASTQIDILLYSSDAPVLFRDGDLVFVQPEAVRGIIEVKTEVHSPGFLKDAILKLKEIGDMLPAKNRAFLSIFSYDSKFTDPKKVLELLQDGATSIKQTINLLCLGDSCFVRYWEKSLVVGNDNLYEKWHSYSVKKMAYGYFIHNVLLALSPDYIDANQDIWFPKTSKEIHKTGEIRRIRGRGEDQSLMPYIHGDDYYDCELTE